MSKRFLIVKTSALGDIVQAFPVLHYLRSRFPEAQVDWVAEAPCAGLVERHPQVSRALIVDTGKWKRAWWQLSNHRDAALFRKKLREHHYDAVFDLQGNVKSGIISRMAKTGARVGFGRASVPEWPNCLVTNAKFDPPAGANIREDYLSLARQWAGDAEPFEDPGVRLRLTKQEKESLLRNLSRWRSANRPLLLVFAGSRWPNKKVQQDAMSDFLCRIQEEQAVYFLFGWGSDEERAEAEALLRSVQGEGEVLERFSLACLQNVMGEADKLIAMDSLPLHLCGTTSTPSFAIFGASLASKYNPPGDNSSAFQGVCPYGRSFEKRCPILRTCETGACIRSLSGLDLYRAYHTRQSLVN